MGTRAGGRRTGPKCIAIVGPFASGKTTLLEAILARTGAIPRQNPVSSGNTVSDHSPEARAHAMSVEATFATTDFMGEQLTFVDCPGSIEFAFEAEPVLAACDLAVVVAEADEKKIPALQLIMRKLDDLAIPRILFLNKVDKAVAGVRETLKMLQPASSVPLLLRQIPVRKDGIVIGSIDLALERAYIYREYAESEVAEIPGDDKARELEARFSMLETLADHDDHLMEQLLEEIEPPKDAIFDDLSADLRAGAVTPVLIGTAEKGNGVLRLLKAIRHDAPDVEATRKRLGAPDGQTVVQVMKTIHTAHGGKLSVSRVLSGQLADAAELYLSNGDTAKVSGIYRMLGKDQSKLTSAKAGDTVALGKLDNVKTGQTLSSAKGGIRPLVALEPPQPVFAFALRPKERKDEVKMSAAIQRLAEEDPSLSLRHNQDSAETVLSGHGEMHLRVVRERLEGKNQIPIEGHTPAVPYRETIRKSAQQRGRHKKQSGGHGQFGDVVIEIKPLPRGSGFQFSDTITGGVVPKTYIQSVETGIRDYLKTGPLGFPVVDVAVNLSDGSYHAVDSSDMAFQMAAKLAMKEGMAACSPVLLEPVMKVEIVTPSDATSKIIALIPQRRGQILGYDARPDWPGWDVVEATMPQAEIGDLIIELRSATAGVASYKATFDHMAELTGRLADEAMNANGKAA
ncbi:elongation factor G [Mesorhizobium sp. M2D.F.Ca.ET.185.01.1.1]|uniref:elongation factor G n=1 Tax=unclassified Mesorhizobium TaxID=325217 RepID=UPI000FCBEF5B|nr:MULTISPECIES: elongation factor G [unclassified Mesorhizobium]TGP82374.1 elongation factor G [bacterium M00.F.Ca.ET.227.01.1.1]TGP94128.1 elongation factor G [bacterium M00.F.Ca.ET.221.01.1.1]TGP97582.1 elongation factor G [bacterium M00.F.Ca.ET.222.01.1.1]TGU12106.1 elongation factor G [bacterium M00.F.Ca.ET.163.01.1.1]TGU35636.1 elongation factor G [bacterium M00.F.Ca.ET.156.01.1.1]TGU48563.1 elongation factor G [bacterium M00.F.Ca.ET.146.01.1.1]TGV70365.1 elongation factor G [Mesorhizo